MRSSGAISRLGKARWVPVTFGRRLRWERTSMRVFPLMHPVRRMHHLEDTINPEDISLVCEPLEESTAFSASSGAAPPASIAASLSPSRPARFVEEKKLDTYSRARVVNFMKRYVKSRAIESGSDVFDTTSVEMSEAITVFHSRVNIPLSHPACSSESQDGLWAHGLAYSAKEAETLAAMHAERIVDDLGYHIYTLPSMQRKHAAAARQAGRNAPSPDDADTRVPQVSSFPPPLQRIMGYDESEDGTWQLIDLRGGATPFVSPPTALLSPCVMDLDAQTRMKGMLAAVGLTLTQLCSVAQEEALEKGDKPFFCATITIPSELTKYPEETITAAGKAVSREDAIALACMHAELILDALDIALFPHDDKKQKEHAVAAWSFGRPAPLPGAEPKNPLHVCLPLPLKQLIIGKRGRISPKGYEEDLVHRHHCVASQCSDYSQTTFRETDAIDLLKSFLKSRNEKRSENPFFHDNIQGNYKSTVVLPLPDSFGIRGGVGIAPTIADADTLAAMHCLDVLTAFGMPIKSDDEEQRKWAAQRAAALGLGSDKVLQPSDPSPPGRRLPSGGFKKWGLSGAAQDSHQGEQEERKTVKRRPAKRAKSVETAAATTTTEAVVAEGVDGNAAPLVSPAATAVDPAVRLRVPKENWSLEPDSPDGYIMVSPADEEAYNASSSEYALLSPRKIDRGAKARMTLFLANTGRRFDDVFYTEYIDADDNGGLGVHKCVAQLPLPRRFGPRVAVGEAASSSDSEQLAAMHAELILDTLGVPIYSNPAHQRKHAEVCLQQGRWATMGTAMDGQQQQPSDTPSPPPLRREYVGSLHWEKQQAKKKPITVSRHKTPPTPAPEDDPSTTCKSTSTTTTAAAAAPEVEELKAFPEEVAYTPVLESELDMVSKSRVQYYLRHLKKPEIDADYLTELGRGTIMHTCKWSLPLPDAFGGGEREVRGIASVKRDSEILSWMHAERVLDALNIPIYANLPKFQAWHAARVSSLGRSAPCHTGGPPEKTDVSGIPIPPPCRLTALQQDVQRPVYPTAPITAESWERYVEECGQYIQETNMQAHNAFFQIEKVPRTGDAVFDEALDDVDAAPLSEESKMLLQKYCDSSRYSYPVFWKTQTVGPITHRVSWVTIPVPGFEYIQAQGVGANKDIAQKKAAMHAMAMLSRIDPDYESFCEQPSDTIAEDDKDDEEEFNLDTFEAPLLAQQSPEESKERTHDAKTRRKFKRSNKMGTLPMPFNALTEELTSEGKQRVLNLLAVFLDVPPPIVRQMVRRGNRRSDLVRSTAVDFTDEEGVVWSGVGKGSGSVHGNTIQAFDNLYSQMLARVPLLQEVLAFLKQNPFLDPRTVVNVTLTREQKHRMREIVSTLPTEESTSSASTAAVEATLLDLRRGKDPQAAAVTADSGGGDEEDASVSGLFKGLAVDDVQRWQDSQSLLEKMQDKITSPEYVEKYATSRERLSIANRKEDILRAIEDRQVVIICGTTGCGKTTQVPQFILDDLTEKGKGGDCSVLITQPRRLSAVSIAQRVSAERLEEIGDTCGYTIRFDSRPGKHINFCTSGILLRTLHTNPQLDGIKYLIIDEIHERDINSDFLLVIIKKLLATRKDLRLILMSATLQAEQFGIFFNGAPIINVDGYVFPVKEVYLEDLVPFAEERNFITPLLKEAAAVAGRCADDAAEDDWSQPKVSRYGVLEAKSAIDYPTIQLAVDYALRSMDLSNSSVLVFLPGWDEIMKAKEILERNVSFQIIPLHSSVSAQDQMQCFLPAKEGKVKIILSTNIAESGVTIDDVGAVIDVGRAKEKSWFVNGNRNHVGQVGSVSQLLTVYASKANCVQRRGRAGRTRPGVCIRLYSKKHFEQLHQFQTPEMLRTPLDSLCLQILSLRLGDPRQFLQGALEPPADENVELAMKGLENLGAVAVNQELTPLGYRLSMLPVDPRVGKMIMVGALLRCLDSALTIASTYQADVFVTGHENREPTRLHREDLSKDTKSDAIASVNGFNYWVSSHYQKAPTEVAYDLQERLLSVPQLLLVSRYKQQFYDILKHSKFLVFTDDDFGNRRKLHMDKEDIFVDTSSLSEDSLNVGLVKCVVASGLFPNISVNHGKRKLRSKQISLLHTSSDSVVHKTAQKDITHPFFVYTELSKLQETRRLIAHGLTNVSIWVILLMATNSMPITYHHNLSMGEVDEWIHFRASFGTLELIKKFRHAMNWHFNRKFSDPLDTENNVKVDEIRSIIKELVTTPIRPNTLATEEWQEKGTIIKPINEQRSNEQQGEETSPSAQDLLESKEE